MKRAEIVRLCEQLLFNIDLQALPIEAIVNQAYRVAELAGCQDYVEFLFCEMNGYPAPPSGRTVDEFMRWTGRWDEATGTYFPLAAGLTASDLPRLEGKIRELESKTLLMREPNKLVAHMQQIQRLNDGLVRGRLIIHRLRGVIYRFASHLVAELKFAEQANEIFARYQARVDGKIARAAADAVSKLPDVFERLHAGNPEATSHALTSCRRIIDAFADAVFPARVEPIVVRGQELDCGADKIKNRLRAYIASKTASRSRYERLNRNLASLYERVCTGVHSEVTPAEAQALVLNTYLLLGELVELDPSPAEQNGSRGRDTRQRPLKGGAADATARPRRS